MKTDNARLARPLVRVSVLRVDLLGCVYAGQVVWVMTFLEYVEEHKEKIKPCDCGALEFAAHPRTCASVISWDAIFKSWRYSGITIFEGGLFTPDYKRKADEYFRTRCSACMGPFHPATGHQWTADCRLCNGCTRDFIKWIKHREANMGHVRKGQIESFTDAALKSIKGDS